MSRWGASSVSSSWPAVLACSCINACPATVAGMACPAMLCAPAMMCIPKLPAMMARVAVTSPTRRRKAVKRRGAAVTFLGEKPLRCSGDKFP